MRALSTELATRLRPKAVFCPINMTVFFVVKQGSSERVMFGAWIFTDSVRLSARGHGIAEVLLDCRRDG